MQSEEQMGTEQPADGLGPPWVKVGGGVGKGVMQYTKDGASRDTCGYTVLVSSKSFCFSFILKHIFHYNFLPPHPIITTVVCVHEYEFSLSLSLPPRLSLSPPTFLFCSVKGWNKS